MDVGVGQTQIDDDANVVASRPRRRVDGSRGPASVRSSIDGLERVMSEMHALHVVALWQLLRAFREYQLGGTLRADGVRSPADYLVARFGIGYSTAKRYVKLSDQLASLPELDRAMSEGRLSIEVIEAVASFATPSTDAELTEKALGWTAAEAREAARLAKPVSPLDDDEAERSATFRAWLDEKNNMVRFAGMAPADQGAALMAAVDREMGASPKCDPATGVLIPIATRRATALLSLAGARIGADADPDRATVVVYAEHNAFHSHQEQAQLVDVGVNLTRQKLELMSCDCYKQTVIVDDKGTPIGIGRTSKNVPRWLRRQVVKRDHGFCQFPGCDSRRFLDCHHMVHWSKGGPTDLDNLVLLCRFHHRWLHLTGWNLAPKQGARGFDTVGPTGNRVRLPNWEAGLSEATRAAVFDPPPVVAAKAA